NNDIIPQKYAYLSEGIEEEDFEEKFIVSVDVAGVRLLGDAVGERYADKVDLSIDHHESSRLFAGETYVESDSASACEIIYLIIKALGAEIDSGIASCIYTGMSTDTGCFRYSNVTPRTHLIAAELIALGAEHSKINEIMFDTKTVGSIMLEKMCYESLEFFGDGKVAVISVSQKMLSDCGVDKSALDAIKPITRQIEGVGIGVTVKEEDGGKIGISIRTSEEYDACRICGAFGGGGHVRASGCELKGTMQQAKEQIVDYIINNVI
ncbi:MAG: bifunctional oligoribonuclease/PAP phosphatase NrnA, partial [Clostridia bacterium]|nr:bifunctional oligoribonuclease/PAP phosphatase NrnA [Clostridia bacterium]